jgi:hypothetical protein
MVLGAELMVETGRECCVARGSVDAEGENPRDKQVSLCVYTRAVKPGRSADQVALDNLRLFRCSRFYRSHFTLMLSCA